MLDLNRIHKLNNIIVIHVVQKVDIFKRHDFSRFFSKFPGIFSLFLKSDIQVVLNINMRTY